MDLAAGLLLVAEPAMLDPNFKRAVVLLCEHASEGSVGLVLNRPTDLSLPEVLPEPVGLDHQIFLGGPVQRDTLHFLHDYAHAVNDAIGVAEDIAWGGTFDEVAEQIRDGVLDASRFRFFAGYAGWGPGQLIDEVADEGWLIRPASRDLVFDEAPETLWRRLIIEFGGDAALLVNYPDDPATN
jgi:putative transcriptional regulator